MAYENEKTGEILNTWFELGNQTRNELAELDGIICSLAERIKEVYYLLGCKSDSQTMTRILSIANKNGLEQAINEGILKYHPELGEQKS